MKIYQIDSSARKEGSTSRALAKKLLEKIKKPDDEVIYRDLNDEMVFVSGLTESGMNIDQKDQNENHRKMFELSNKLVKEYATKAGLIDDINNFPQKFKTIVGERGITLSGGQRQRTALGRALLVNSPIVVLDDALASVDNKTAAKIIKEMRDRSNKTILMISHQLSVAATCDRVLVMDKGKIVQEGNHKDLVQEKGLYKQLWERELAIKIVKS